MTIKDIILESLKDIPTTNQNYHYSNSDIFVKILNSGHLKSYDNYPAKSIEGKDIAEIATMRKTKDNELAALKKTNPGAYETKKENLSVNIGKIRFTLFIDRIKSGVRGAKVKQIAELPKYELSHIRKDKNNIVKQYIKKYPDIDEDLEDFITTKNQLDRARKLGKLNVKYKQSDRFSDFTILYNGLKTMDKYLKPEEKEGEERIVFKDNSGNIPLDEKFMRIEFMPGAEKELHMNTNLIDGMKYYENLFVKNKTYEKVVLEINNYLRSDGITFNEYTSKIKRTRKY